MLNGLASRVYDRAERFHHGQHIADLISGYDAVIVDGPATEALHPGAAFAFYGPDRVRLQQVVWPDPAGRYPWNTDYSLDADVQPLIGRPKPGLPSSLPQRHRPRRLDTSSLRLRTSLRRDPLGHRRSSG